jgi:hypothetical protein
MMKLSVFFLTMIAALESATAFCNLPYRTTSQVVKQPVTFLKYAIVYPDDEIEEDTTPAEATPTQKNSDGSVASFEGYKDYNELAEVNQMNVDSYDNAAGGIVPGFQLSSLCSDD